VTHQDPQLGPPRQVRHRLLSAPIWRCYVRNPVAGCAFCNDGPGEYGTPWRRLYRYFDTWHEAADGSPDGPAYCNLHCWDQATGPVGIF
jgi:hypothetical protein